MADPLFPDCYRILQVNPEAEAEVIEAAYRRLMRKYHPDVAGMAALNNPDMLARAKEINEAYDVLGDPTKRAQYDRYIQKTQRTPAACAKDQSALPDENLEKRVLPVRCARSKQYMQIILARPRDGEYFQVIGFEPLDRPQRVQFDWFQRIQELTERLMSRGERESNERDLFMSDVDWSDSECPECHYKHLSKKGSYVFWVRCGYCGQLSCGSAVKDGLRGAVYYKCAWCNRGGRIPNEAHLGKRSVARLKCVRPQLKLGDAQRDALERPSSKQLKPPDR